MGGFLKYLLYNNLLTNYFGTFFASFTNYPMRLYDENSNFWLYIDLLYNN